MSTTSIRLDQVHERLSQYPDSFVCARSARGDWLRKTYAEVMTDVERLGRRLTSSGIPKGAMIGILADNSYEWLIWDLACLRAEIVTVAFPETFRHQDLLGIINEYDVGLLVTDLKGSNPQPKHVISIDDTFSDANISYREGAISTNSDVFTKCFSSGTTGRLKGLNISKAGTEYILTKFKQSFDVDSNDGYFVLLPLSHIQQRAAIYGCLFLGVNAAITSFSHLFQDLRAFKPTFMLAPPSFYRSLLDMVRSKGDAKYAKDILGGRIRFLLTGMAPINVNIIHKMGEMGLLLLEAYGLGETGLISWNSVDHHKAGTVGRPVSPAEIEFLGDGEIVLHRRFPLSAGYFGFDGAETFLSNGGIATGDIGYLDTDGYLVLSGRKKNIVITSGGIKFHPEEVESKICDVEGVEHAVVYYSEHQDKLSAVVALKSGVAADELDVKNGILRSCKAMPLHKRVTDFVFTDVTFTVENGLLTRSLKLDRDRIIEEFGAPHSGDHDRRDH